MRLRLELAYDGTGFSGWAAQPDRRTVEGTLELAVERVFGAVGRLTVAARTDAGVHARGQVAHVDVSADAWSRVAHDAARRLRRKLPQDIRILAMAEAPDGFDARKSAVQRDYTYRVCDDPSGVDPLRRHDVVTVRRRLDVEAMHAAAAALTGEHDFAAFCRGREGASTVRRLVTFDVRRPTAGSVVCDVSADAFCHSMVRAMVGALLAVGHGRQPRTWPADILRGEVRDAGVVVAPASGLTLERVVYPPDKDLVEWSRRPRILRGPVFYRSAHSVVDPTGQPTDLDQHNASSSVHPDPQGQPG